VFDKRVQRSLEFGESMTFVQVMTIETDNIAPVQEMMAEWDAKQSAAAPGYQSNRILKDQDQGNYLIEVEFSTAELAEANNGRPETAVYANRLNELVTGEVGFSNYDVV
jgi:hypothetical protein